MMSNGIPMLFPTRTDLSVQVYSSSHGWRASLWTPEVPVESWAQFLGRPVRLVDSKGRMLAVAGREYGLPLGMGGAR